MSRACGKVTKKRSTAIPARDLSVLGRPQEGGPADVPAALRRERARIRSEVAAA
ncbi:hypothetical protein [Streptomyces sp. NPDC005784]|uniref:hypothetical protein n=1 Tax=Streptomyces sp. NPDC005784 TaxID=3364731 RepID=UPI0036BD7048